MRSFFYIFLAALIVISCSKQDNNNANATQTQPASTDISDEVFSFDINTLTPGCPTDSQIVCAINMSIKCTINPQFSECAENASSMPKFVFMEDESLQRPTSQSYKITKIKPLQDNTIEVYTQSTCNGNWFGLCNGNIIYVMDSSSGKWIVKDIYAVES